jgi:hypothetical protein
MLAWTTLQVSNGALEGMNNKMKAIDQRAVGFETTCTYIANVNHCCAEPPLPDTLGKGAVFRLGVSEMFSFPP